jgi:hypothetical protein
MSLPRCARCRDFFWVCENHDDKAWDEDAGCQCGAGMPRPDCNSSDRDHPPKNLPGSREIWHIDKGWVN